jgi:hypothetical protein
MNLKPGDLLYSRVNPKIYVEVIDAEEKVLHLEIKSGPEDRHRTPFVAQRAGIDKHWSRFPQEGRIG